MGANLLKLIQENNGAEIERIARNMVASQGKDFDTEFNSFKRALGILKRRTKLCSTIQIILSQTLPL